MGKMTLEQVREKRAFHKAEYRRWYGLEQRLVQVARKRLLKELPGLPGRMQKGSQAEYAYQALTLAGKELATNELVDAIFALGYRSDADRKTLVNGVYSTLRRTPDVFVRVRPGVWDLKNRRET